MNQKHCVLYALSFFTIVLIFAGFALNYRSKQYQSEVRFFEENREKFDELVLYAENHTNLEAGCIWDAAPETIGIPIWTTQNAIYICRDQNRDLVWMSVANPYRGHLFTYIPGQTDLVRGYSVSLAYAGTCYYELEDEWFLCGLSTD